MKNLSLSVVGTCLALAFTGLLPAHAAVDADAAQASLKKSDCLKCHALDKTKAGPSFKDIAKKYSGQAGAEAKLTTHITTTPTITMDGNKEEHKPMKSKDAAEIKNVVQWILATAPAAKAEAAKPAAAAVAAVAASPSVANSVATTADAKQDAKAGAASCSTTATEKKLAGAAKKSFLNKCKKEAVASCDKAAAEKSLAGAAKKSFTKKCLKDAVGA